MGISPWFYISIAYFIYILIAVIVSVLARKITGEWRNLYE